MLPIYLDNNATTLLLPEVAEAMQAAHAAGYANPASQHREGRRARAVLEDARETIGRLLGAEVSRFAADQVLLTSGGTESNQLALRGLAKAFAEKRLAGKPGRVIVSTIEHPSITGAAEQLKSEGWDVQHLPVDAAGVVQVDQLAPLLTPETAVVSVMLANNETGVLQPIQELAAICREAGVLLHTDATQAVGKIPVNFQELGVDGLTCTAHKLHGPRGIGVLLHKNGVKLAPLWQGGFQQAGLRPGTEDVALAVGLQSALQFAAQEGSERAVRLREMRDLLETSLLEGWPDAVIHGQSADRLPHTTCISLPPLDRQALVMALDLAGVCCSTGSACASGSSEPSPVLLAMGVPEPLIRSAIRLSLGCLNTVAEVQQAAQRILMVSNDLRQKVGA